MSQINIEIKKQRIRNIQIDMSKDLPKEFSLSVESEAQIKTPKQKGVKTALLLMETRISIPDTNEIDISISAEFILEFNEVPSDYKEITKEQGLPLAQSSLLKSIDNILFEMGYKKLDLAKQF